MRLIGSDGHGVELGVVGYQFPDAVDLQQRQSRLVIEGSASCPEGTWSLRWQALTAEDAVELARWLQRSAAQSTDGRHDDSGWLDFTEPNWPSPSPGPPQASSSFRISVDLELLPPWRLQARSGDPFVVTCRPTPESVLNAATDWATEIKPYPPAGDANP
jgi:hypothetical protein